MALTQTPRAKDRRTKEWRRRTTYSIWYSMVQRCTNEDHHAYLDYGGRGICVHELWLPSPPERPHIVAFGNFVKDVGLRPSQYLSLDRLNVNGNYEPGNVKWATGKEQGRNKRNSIFVPDPNHPTKLIPAAELAERLKLSYQQLRYRLQLRGEWPGDVNNE